MASFDYDLFVIGGGSGGVRAARLAGQMGKKVGLAEVSRLGGTCVIRGCVPKKLYVYASAYAQNFTDSASFGWKLAQPHFDWHYLVSQKEQEITRLEGLYGQGLKGANVEIFASRAHFIDAHHIELVATGERVSAEKILIATGGRPKHHSEILGNKYCISSDEVFDLPTLPQSIIIAGGGYIAVEFANIFHGLGVKTSLIYRADRILRGFDADLRGLLGQMMQDKGIRMISETRIKQVEKTDESHHVTLSNGEMLQADQVMLALGRNPNTHGLHLEAAGVKTDEKGAIIVNEVLATSQPHIFAVGDVTNRVQLTPVAIHEAMCFIQTAFHEKPTAPDHELIATAVFSQPEIGTIGLSEEEAAAKLPHVEIYRALFTPMRNSISGRGEKMLTKLVVDGQSRLVVGAHILGDGAGEMAQLLAIALKGKLTKDVFDATMAVHPTAAEELVTMYRPTYLYRHGVREEI